MAVNLAHAVGPSNAALMIITGDPIDADRLLSGRPNGSPNGRNGAPTSDHAADRSAFLTFGVGFPRK
jgi:hypothetical protein